MTPAFPSAFKKSRVSCVGGGGGGDFGIFECAV